MKFVLVDRISLWEPGQRLIAHKSVSLAEEYLQDHFPRFPVLPGVLMLEALTQAAAWLVRASLDFGPSVVLLREARNVTYKSFVQPGRTLDVEVSCRQLDAGESVFQASGTVDGRPTLKGQLVLRHLNLADQDAALAETDQRLRERHRRQFELLGGPGARRDAACAAPA
ncbi:MAG: beta-hydroxyacyl-ACP dehydratase [Phycisphaerales bacterium]|nr:beta-hydroxyacyl-ACP dehydratase [Phycisphaerales bacterium]